MSNSNYEQKPGQGSLFRNTRKETENQADFSGSIKLPDGTDCWINGWEKTDKNGNPWYSLSVRPKQDRQSAAPPPPRQAAPPRRETPPPRQATTHTVADLQDEDDIPF